MKNRMFLSLAMMTAAVVMWGCHHQMNAEDPRRSERQTVAIEMTVPDPAWTLTIQEVYAASDRLLVISELERDPDVMAAQVITQVRDEVEIEAPDLPAEHYILGKTFRWSEESHNFIDDRKELKDELSDARLVFRNDEDE